MNAALLIKHTSDTLRLPCVSIRVSGNLILVLPDMHLHVLYPFFVPWLYTTITSRLCEEVTCTSRRARELVPALHIHMCVHVLQVPLMACRYRRGVENGPSKLERASTMSGYRHAPSKTRRLASSSTATAIATAAHSHQFVRPSPRRRDAFATQRRKSAATVHIRELSATKQSA